jgi:4'-phosphopantetheinyl transferase
LASGEPVVHLVWVDLALIPWTEREARLWLSDPERTRADAFVFAANEHRFVMRRSALRWLLASYLALDPRELAISEDLGGKPRLARGPRFSTSSSGDMALFAFTLDREVGVDVERVDPRTSDMDIARRFFSDEEVAALGSAGDGHVVEAFLDLWTRKEALAKAAGRGVAAYLSRALPVGQHMTCGRSWTITQIQGVAGYRAAIAVEGGPSAIEMFCDPFGVAMPRLVGSPSPT